MKKGRIHKTKSDFGIGDYYKFYNKKYKRDIPKDNYKKIIEDFNNNLIDLIIESTLTYQLPYIGMEIMIKKKKERPKIVDGKLVNNAPINWKITNELWEKDIEAKKKKILVRHNNYHTSGYVFTVYCKKFKCNLKYRSLYKFNPNRKFTTKLAKRLLDPDKDNLDAFLLY